MIASTTYMTTANEPFLGYYPEAELVFALVCPLGAEHKTVTDTLQMYIKRFKYGTNQLRLSEFFPDLFVKLGEEWNPSTKTAELADYKIDAGNQIRELTKTNEFLALFAASLIADRRAEQPLEQGNEDKPENWKRPLGKMAHIISTLKRPEEVRTLRRIYGTGFFLIGISPSKKHLDSYFKQRRISNADAAALIEKDTAELKEYGQQTRDTFQLADVFFSTENYHKELLRFLDLVFGCPTHTPTAEEQAMFMAYAASLRSGDLSRQVGAAIIDRNGDLLSVGFNEVPKFGGGLYGPEKGNDRDITRKCDSNVIEKNKMIEKILKQLDREAITLKKSQSVLKPTGLTDITEFGRSVHAEMEALLACARTGRSVRGATLYTTTFPCHNCCRHIIATGIEQVVYIEPYPKSKAPTLHSDAISVDKTVPGKIPFVPFIGIGPRRYFDLFSLKLSTGYLVERKEEESGILKNWIRSDAPVRLQMPWSTYLDREILAREDVNKLLLKKGEGGVEHSGEKT